MRAADVLAGKGFCWVSHADDIAMVKSTHDEQGALIAIDPATYSQGRTTATSAWITMRLAGVDPDELRDLLAEGWRMTAPKSAVAAYDAENGLAG